MATSSRPDESVEEWIEDNLQKQVVKVQTIGRSSWSSQYCYVTRDAAFETHRYFVKTAPASKKEMFHSESIGLNALHRTGMVVVPEVKHVGTTAAGLSFLVSDYLSLEAGVSPDELGKSIALMHLAEPDDEMAKKGYFGFPVDNTLGGTPQPNGWMDNWATNALYLDLPQTQGAPFRTGDSRLTKMGEELCEHLELFFEGVEVRPSVLHGDLWAGNYAAVDSRPAIFDPATYYGHHEAEFGMSWCASFSTKFWKAYHEVIPKAPGFEERHLIYTLYHYLNHYNLFGSGYYQQCQSILTTLTREVMEDV